MLEEYDAALALDVSTPYLDTVALARGVCRCRAKTGQARRGEFHGGPDCGGRYRVSEGKGSPNLATGERAMTVLARMADYETYKILWAANLCAVVPGAAAALRRSLFEPEAMASLKENGISRRPSCALPPTSSRWLKAAMKLAIRS